MCQGCINRQRKLVAWLCRRGITRMCEKAQARLAKMEASQK